MVFSSSVVYKPGSKIRVLLTCIQVTEHLGGNPTERNYKRSKK